MDSTHFDIDTALLPVTASPRTTRSLKKQKNTAEDHAGKEVAFEVHVGGAAETPSDPQGMATKRKVSAPLAIYANPAGADPFAILPPQPTATPPPDLASPPQTPTPMLQAAMGEGMLPPPEEAIDQDEGVPGHQDGVNAGSVVHEPAASEAAPPSPMDTQGDGQAPPAGGEQEAEPAGTPMLLPGSFTNEVNPHFLDTSSNPPPPPMNGASNVPLNNGPFPVHVIRKEQLLMHMEQSQRAIVEATPDAYAAIVPLGAGLAFGINHATFAQEAEKVIKALAEAVDDDPSLIRVVAPSDMPPALGNAPPFMYPWTYIVRGMGQNTRRAALSKELLVSNKVAAFRVWSILIWATQLLMSPGTAVRDAPADMAAALARLKEVAESNAEFSNIIEQATGQRADWVGLSPLERMRLVTATWQLHFATATCDYNHPPVAHYQLHAPPLTPEHARNDELEGEFIRIMRNMFKFVDVDLFAMHCVKVFDPCAMCKDTSHATLDCPLPRTNLWYGPKIEDLPAQPKDQLPRIPLKSSNRARTKPKRGFPPARGRGGARVSVESKVQKAFAQCHALPKYGSAAPRIRE
ncbi:hypothetical protein FISHEDRAFT_60637 [Fistulina hepatica ATCC 64428]|uniref:Uncharacterized protein n=1 Tax=Fistulina hepatica ATCC 64428 TaxID=1128425 RepID=A0A0D7A711_9AGAR|nr:hypothetical protein FISHEDRAFT_60637 [Fistulina hepatica ATCC 64428]